MAVGNAVGSNIFNILMVLGVASAINPVALIRENIIDIVILIVFSLIVWIYAATKAEDQRKEGISMVCMYLDLCRVYYLEIKYRNEDKRERLYGNFTEGTEDKNTQNIENTEKGSSFYSGRVFLFLAGIFILRGK